MKLNEYFDKIFVVNLNRRKDRLDSFDSQSKKNNFIYERYEAFDVSEIPYPYNICDKTLNHTNVPLGAVGCYISHFMILEKSIELGYEKILIFEDDVILTDNFEEKIMDIMDRIDKNWDFLYLGCTLPSISENLGGYAKVYGCLTTHSYALSRGAIKFLYDALCENFFTEPIDVVYSKHIMNMNSFLTIPYLTYQMESFSDISKNVVFYLTTKEKFI